MTSVISFHSYKGGTGKTTLACNMAAMLAKNGYKVYLLDMDVYSPSLKTYFNFQGSRKWLNDFLLGSAQLEEIIYDYSKIIEDCKGKFYVLFSNSKRSEILNLDGNLGIRGNSQINLLQNFLNLRADLVANDADFIIIDTSPGIRFWSLNSIIVSDIVLLTLKIGDMDIEGTSEMLQEIYYSLSDYGTKCFLLFNRTDGYCIPPSNIDIKSGETKRELFQELSILSDNNRIKMMGKIPCYCDIQFLKKEFLTVLKHPNHPMSLEINNILKKINNTN